jgi:hypothetical protein
MGSWRDDQARALLEFSRANDVPVVAAEFFNEPSLPIGVPKNYDAAAYRRDFTRFVAMAREVAPELRIVGPGGIADIAPLVLSASISPTDLLDASAGALEVFSYHFYPKVSERCGSTEGPEIALNAEFLSRLNAVNVFFEDLRDRYVPGAPMWITETAQAACGGDRWAAHFRDVFRYVDTLGKLAGGDGNVVFHNTLAASDYGLLDEDGFEPRPNYWAAVLWQRVMGTEVLAVDAPAIPNFAVYAHRTPGTAAGVSYAIVNSSETDERVVTTRSGECQMFLLTAESLDSSTVSLNGVPLTTAADGTLPSLNAATVRGTVNVPPASIAFVVEPADERRPNDSRPVR